MKWRTLASILWAVVSAGCGTDLGQSIDLVLPSVIKATRAEIENEQVVASSYMVAFKGRSIRHLQLTMVSYRAEWAFHNAYLRGNYNYDSRVKDVRYIHALDFARQGLEGSPDQFLLTPGLRRSLVGQDDMAAPAVLTEVNFSSPEEAEEVLDEWEKAGKIWFAEPNYQSRIEQGIFTDYKTTYTAGTPWWHTSIKLLDAFELIATSESKPSDDDILANPPVVAVLDSGLDVEHPAFEGRIFKNSSPGIAGCVGDVNGCDTTAPAKGELGTGNVMPFGWAGGVCNQKDLKNCQHGTHVAGIIASNYNGAAGNEGVGGVCPVCKVMPIKIISGPTGKGAAKDSAIINGLVYLTRFQKKSDQSTLVRIANSSFGKYSRSRAVALMVSILAKNHGLLVVGAASNEDSMLRAYPAALNDALAVSAVDNKDRKASYSNFGAWVDVAAPGGDSPGTGGFGDAQLIVSTVPRGSSDSGGDYDGKQGTSMAAPVVAGVAGLVLAADPKRGFRALRSSIIDSADARLYAREGDTSFNQSYYVNIGVEVKRPLLGSGVVDAAAAILNDKRTGVLVSGIDRVHTGCSTVSGRGSVSGGDWMLLLAPLLAAAYGLLRRGSL